jgi:hypothetical protein
MLEKNGFGDEKSAATFVQKYNATVFYDDSLSLKENAGKRQARSYIFVRCLFRVCRCSAGTVQVQLWVPGKHDVL